MEKILFEAKVTFSFPKLEWFFFFILQGLISQRISKNFFQIGGDQEMKGKTREFQMT